MSSRLASALCASVLICLPASAQLVAVRLGANAVSKNLWYVDVANDERVLLTEAAAAAVAVDDASGTIWLSDTEGLSVWSYGSTQPPVFLGPIQHAGAPLFPDGLASGAGRLFALSQSAVYEIDVATLSATPVPLQPPIVGAVEGFAFHAQEGAFYAANLKEFGSRLYRIDLLGGGTTTLLNLPPVQLPYDLGGLAAHAGTLYFVPDDFRPIRTFDLASGQFTGELTSPFPADGLLSGAEWAPSLVPPAGPRFYCQPKADFTAGPDAPGFLTFEGVASAGAGSGFSLIATQLAAGQVAWFVYSTTGAASTPFGGGTLCVAPPLSRLAGPVLPSFGSAVRIDFNAYIASGADLALVAGAQVWIQAASRAPFEPPGEQIALSQGLTTLIHP